jgi:hypothetical protein
MYTKIRDYLILVDFMIENYSVCIIMSHFERILGLISWIEFQSQPPKTLAIIKTVNLHFTQIIDRIIINIKLWFEPLYLIDTTPYIRVCAQCWVENEFNSKALSVTLSHSIQWPCILTRVLSFVLIRFINSRTERSLRFIPPYTLV